MPALEHTSVPGWAVPDQTGPGDAAAALDGSGASYLVVAVGPPDGPAAGRARAWVAQAAPRPARLITAADAASASASLAEALGRASVGVRVALTGPVGDCLTLRGTALGAGIEDDELQVAPVFGGVIDVHCCHCGALTRVAAAIDDVVPCMGCDRSLLVYHHVSRRTGRFLGFQVDAEEVAR
ncbi:dimethylamine monooxygenase subunit DmmA family protein [Nocardioides sambongensis]|uniref:dimethylamine monooxygenase subunit DmmA family protein n=1 Tax=Nocardioides sambongensis TaxID=2589074 RepID=UPI00112E71FB|nr:dimethylamine monooxygenase subunit DmmA family protein [Nocardioides sambongensis]